MSTNESGSRRRMRANQTVAGGRSRSRREPDVERAIVSSNNLSSTDSAKRSVFVSYCHADSEYLDRLLVHLRPLQRHTSIDVWVDRKLKPGDRWKREIERALRRAEVAVLLLSADFYASEFIDQVELPLILQRTKDKNLRVLPLVAKPCRFTRDANLNQFQSLNDPREPLMSMNPSKQERFYELTAAEIERVLRE